MAWPTGVDFESPRGFAAPTITHTYANVGQLTHCCCGPVGQTYAPMIEQLWKNHPARISTDDLRLCSTTFFTDEVLHIAKRGNKSARSRVILGGEVCM